MRRDDITRIIQRKKPGDPPLIRLWSGNHMFACGIVMVGLSADSPGEVLDNAINRESDEDTAYFPWLDGSMLLVGLRLMQLLRRRL